MSTTALTKTATQEPIDNPTGSAPRRLNIGIAGMTCASCVGRVEKAIRAVAGVDDVSVNLATERASIVAQPSLEHTAIAAAVRNAGYDIASETVDLDVQGMTCASCVARVERALKAVPGVVGAEANFTTERARVVIRAGSVPSHDLIKAVERAGY